MRKAANSALATVTVLRHRMEGSPAFWKQQVQRLTLSVSGSMPLTSSDRKRFSRLFAITVGWVPELRGPSIRSREPAHGEFDVVVGKRPPALNFGLVCRLG